MAPRRLASIQPLVLVLVVAVTACAAPLAQPSSAPADPTSTAGVASDAPPSDFPVTVTDDLGRDLLIGTEPMRIVSLAPSNTEIVCALGACDRLVGVTDFDDYPPEVAEISDVVIAASVDVELVVAAEPDLVLAAGNELTPTPVIEQLDGLGLAVLVLYPDSIDGVYADIELIGAAIGQRAAAAELVADMKARVADVVAAVAGADRPLTLYEVFHAEGATYTAGEGSFLASMLELAGATALTGDALGSIGAEELVAADPELILLGTATYDPSLAEPQAALDTVRSRPGWSELRAVMDGAVVPYVEDITTTRPGPRIVDGLEALARAIHPDRFE